MKALAVTLGLTLGLVSACQAQTQTQARSSKEALVELQRDMPSEKEFSELLAKADQKVSTFESAVKSAKPALDRIDPKRAGNYLDAAATAHLLISKTTENGAAGYNLVGILATLDDLSLDAANATSFLLAAEAERESKGLVADPKTAALVMALTTASSSCNDIAELIFHATMRLIAAEETALNKLLDNRN